MPSTAVAVVGDDPISKAQLEEAAERQPGGSAPKRSRLVAAANRSSALQDLIFGRWVKAEAAERGIDLPSRQRYAAIMRSTGALDEAALRQFYKSHRAAYAAFPEGRYMKILAFRTKAEAGRAKRRLLHGGSWYRVWQGSFKEAQGGSTINFGLLPGEAPPPLDRAVYDAEVGVMTGPVKTDQAWYVFRLTSIAPGTPGTFASSKDDVRSGLLNELDRRLHASLWRKYRPQTVCRARFLVRECSRG